MTNSKKYNILWADDEIDLLKPHILFLENKGYQVTPVLSGLEAIEAVKVQQYDLLFLDENMPGLTGLDTLQRIKEFNPSIPIVMVTKSEEENLMEQAIGEKIADYLIKPVNPSQLLLCLKKVLEKNSLITETKTTNYRQEFSRISMAMNDISSLEEWKSIYQRLAYWEIELEEGDPHISELLEMQKTEANNLFARFICREYEGWFSADEEDKPLMSHNLMQNKVLPLLNEGEKVFFIVIDNFRFDQWVSIKPMLSELFTIEEDLYSTILPTDTQYARNAIFAGLTPLEIKTRYPEYWVEDEDERSRNAFEEDLLNKFFERRRKAYKVSYNKVYETSFGQKLLSNIRNLSAYDLNVIVLNFVDMLSHTRTESRMIRELAGSEAAYRSLTKSWFKHSITYNLFKEISEMGYRIVLTTDHGSIRVKTPVKVVGEKNITTNLRYKMGRSLSYNEKEVYEVSSPEAIGLPKQNITDKYIFTMEQDFFAYPNNFNHYVQYYKNSFQHGGVSLEEMLVPIITMKIK